MLIQNRIIFYGWRMVAVAVLIMSVSAVVASLGISVLYPLLEAITERMISSIGRSNLVLSLLAGGMTAVPAALVEGLLVDRLGPRRSVFFGLILLGVGLLLGSLSQATWLLWFVVLLLGFGFVMTGSLPMMTMLNNWFDRRKTMAMALALGMHGGLIGITLFVGASLVGVDWRELEWGATDLVLGLVCLALAAPLSRMVWDRPEYMGLLPDGDAPPTDVAVQSPKSEADSGYGWREAIKMRPFWLMVIGSAALVGAAGAISIDLNFYLYNERGYSLIGAGLIVTLSALVGGVCLFVGGYLGDKFEVRKVAFAFSVALGLSAAVLVLVPGLVGVLLFAGLFGIGTGGPGAIMLSMVGRYFGRKAFATITNISTIPVLLVPTVWPIVWSLVLDRTYNLGVPFMGIAAMSLVGGFAFLRMGSPAQWSRLPKP